MGVVVTFSYPTWAATFPQFSPGLNQDQVTNLILPIASTYCRNDGGGPVCDATAQTNLLNLMVAQCAQLMFGPTGTGSTGLVGRISDASQGSVSVRTEFPNEPDEAWYNQTQWGAMYWAMAAPFRTMRYTIPCRQRIFNPYPFR